MVSRFFQHTRKAAGLIGLLLLLLPVIVRAQQPVVYGVFFYSPTCPHCHAVIENDWPGIQKKFGDQLQVLFVDVTTPQGNTTMSVALRALHISETGVPMLVLGSTVLVGDVEIPQRAPTIIRAGLAAGGIGLPAIPGIEALFQAAGQGKMPAQAASSRTAADPANTIAVGIAVGIALSLTIVLVAGWLFLTGRDTRVTAALSGNLGWGAQFLAAVVGVGLTASLVFGGSGNITVTALAGVVSLLFLSVGASLLATSSGRQPSRWLVPLIALAGLVVAGYLAYVEVTLTKAVCGSLSGCNTVQESAYARILGIPVGVIGIFGYIAILVTWAVSRFKQVLWADAALLILALLGAGFSIYLTILEPFAIGASCVWCLTSAVAMVTLLWMAAPAGWNALHSG